ncbi:MAG TPA: hypothetical protein VN618_08030 [Solirubrobacteraceae bacterium]|nr:hypothetical protein [Solirubrobacteraceae bacterium]
MTVAMLALFVAVGGTGYASQFGSSHSAGTAATSAQPPTLTLSALGGGAAPHAGQAGFSNWLS